MGQVFKKKRKLKSGKVALSRKWYIRYRVKTEDGYWDRITEAVSENKKEAARVLRKRETEAFEGRFFDKRKKPKTSFDELAAQYLSWSRVNKKSWTQDEYSIKRLKEHFGGMRLTDIHPLLIEGFKQKRVKQVSKRKVDIELACLKHMFTKALEWGLAQESPARMVRLFRPNNARMRYLDVTEMEKLLGACDDYFRPVVLVAIHSGMRRSEILGLRWADVDMSNGIIHVEDSKNGTRRDVPMSETVKATLMEMKERVECEWVFVHRSDSTKPLRDIRAPFQRALKRAGIENFRFHDCRHTAASWMAMKGIDLYRIQRILGHKDSRMTQRYAHLSPSYLKEAAKVMDEVLGSPLGTGRGSGKVVNLENPVK